MKSLTELIV